MAVRAILVLVAAMTVPSVRASHGAPHTVFAMDVSDAQLERDVVVRHELVAGASGAERRYVRVVRDLVEDRLDVDALPSNAPMTVWTLGDDVIGFEVDGHFAAKAGVDGRERWAFDDGSTLDGPMLARPVKYLAVASRIGVREHPVTHHIAWHAGTDYAAPIGTPVRAAKDGVVVRYVRSWTGGNILTIHHDDGSETRYMHLDARAPGIDEHVRVHQGQLVAFVGKTGRVTGPHLHFEYRDRWGTPIDPVVARWSGADVVEERTLADLRLRRDLMRIVNVDGTRDWRHPLMQLPADVDAVPLDEDDDAIAVLPPVLVQRADKRVRARRADGTRRKVRT